MNIPVFSAFLVLLVFAAVIAFLVFARRQFASPKPRKVVEVMTTPAASALMVQGYALRDAGETASAIEKFRAALAAGVSKQDRATLLADLKRLG